MRRPLTEAHDAQIRAWKKKTGPFASANAKFTRAQLPGSGAWHLSYALLAHAQGSLRSRPRSGARNCLRNSVRLRCGPVQRRRRGERAETSASAVRWRWLTGWRHWRGGRCSRVPSPDCTMRSPGDGAASRRLSASRWKHEQYGRRGWSPIAPCRRRLDGQALQGAAALSNGRDECMAPTSCRSGTGTSRSVPMSSAGAAGCSPLPLSPQVWIGDRRGADSARMRPALAKLTWSSTPGEDSSSGEVRRRKLGEDPI